MFFVVFRGFVARFVVQLFVPFLVDTVTGYGLDPIESMRSVQDGLPSCASIYTRCISSKINKILPNCVRFLSGQLLLSTDVTAQERLPDYLRAKQWAWPSEEVRGAHETSLVR